MKGPSLTGPKGREWRDILRGQMEVPHASTPASERAQGGMRTDGHLCTVVRLVELGRRIEAHFGRPQDIEWCLLDDAFQVVQSRPIIHAVPQPRDQRQENYVY